MDFEAYEMPQGTSQPHTKADQMLDVIKDGIENDDLEFAASIANRQSFLSRVQIAVWMEGEYYAVGDPEQKSKWRAALEEHLDSLKGYEFEDEEKEALSEIEQGLKNEDAEDDSWLSEKFNHGLSQKELDETWNLSEFGRIKTLAIRSANQITDLALAIQMVSRAKSPHEAKMRQFLDHFVFEAVTEFATGKKLGFRQLDMAVEYIDNYASSKEAASRMRSAMDKYVFEEAVSCAPTDIEKAHNVILDHASTKARQEDMFRRLGSN
jgi:hypothetical protein